MRLDDLRVFVQTADAGSFSLAARQLDIAPAYASGAVMRLERAIGTRLFVRNTRHLRLSEAGERYLPHASAALEAMAQGQRALALGQDEIAGPLRLSAPSDFGRNILLPWLDDFQQRYPRVSVQLSISDRAADLVRQPLDAAIRYGALMDSSLVAQPLATDLRRALCAAPAYLARFGTPDSPQALRQHNCLRYFWGDTIYERWRFHLARETQTVVVSGDRTSDDAELVRRWAVAGHGLVYKSRLDLLPDIRAGRLREIFPAGYGEPAPLQLVCAHRSLLTPAIQQLLVFLRTRAAALLAG